MSTHDPTVPGRACGDCALCCKVLGITALAKPMGVWCPHCREGRDCGIYEERPAECRAFYCGWLTTPGLDDSWRPRAAGLVLAYELGGARIAAYVDPGRPDAWRREPYYSALKHWARQPPPHRRQVLACLGRHVVAIQPDRDTDLGVIGPEEQIVTLERQRPDGTIAVETVKLHKDDPRLRPRPPA